MTKRSMKGWGGGGELNFCGLALLRATQRTYIYPIIDKVTKVKSLKQNNMPVFVISNKSIYYIVILQILSNLFLNGQNVSDTVLTVITNNKKMVEIFFQGWQCPPPPLPLPPKICHCPRSANPPLQFILPKSKASAIIP